MRNRSFLRRLVLILMTMAAMLFAVGADLNLNVNCGGQQTQSAHECLSSIGGPVKYLKHLNKDDPHDIVAEISRWESGAQDGAFVQAYALTYDYTVPAGTTITLAPNVYISICTYTAKLTFTEDQIVLSKDENGVVNSGFIVHECLYHGCYAAMKPAINVTETQLKMGYYYALQNGAECFEIPAGNYAFAEYFELSSYIASGKVTFTDPENTTVCFNNLITDMTDPEVLALKNRGVTVYTECLEDKPAPQTHSCVYTQGVDPYPLTQESFDAIVAGMQEEPASASSEDPLQNFLYVFLTEDIFYDGALTVPEGMYLGVCQNGFTFNVPETQGVYVFDCDPHVCIYADLQSVVPVWQAGLDIYSAYATAAGEDFVLPDGAYAMMEDIDFTAFSNLLSATGEYLFCQNGHIATGLVVPEENENCYVCDCTQSVEEIGMYAHECTEINNHITPYLITEELLSEIIDGEGRLSLPEGASEIALAMPMDFELDGTLIIPTGVTMYFCLNGFTLFGSKALAQNSDSPYMFKVEYGAKLYVCDCSKEKTGALVATTVEMMTNKEEGEASVQQFSTPVYNLGVTELDGVTLQGSTGCYNAGRLIVKDSTIDGIYMGIMMNEADAYTDPLHSVKPSLDMEGSTVSAVLAGILKLGGDAVLEDTTINATAFAIMSDLDMLGINASEYNGALVLDDVTVNLTTVIPEGDALALMLLQGLGMVSAITADTNISIEGDLSVNVDEWLLEPYIDEDNGELMSITVAEFVVGANTYFDIADDVELSDEYRVYIAEEFKEDLVLSNKDLSENFILMEGLVAMINQDNEYVVLAPNACGFANNAIVQDVAVGFDGYVTLNFYCEFDGIANEESFLKNENSRVVFNVAGEKVNVHPSEMEDLGDHLYSYSIGFYAKDYQEQIYVQFTNGTYTWTGVMAISVADFLEMSLVSFEAMLANVEATLEDAGATEEAIAEAEQAKIEIVAYKNAILAMLNYCGVSAEYFYERGYELLDEVFAHREVQTVVGGSSEEGSEENSEETGEEENTEEPTEQIVWVETSVVDAMNAVTAETLKGYAPSVKEGSVIPENVQFIGASLILNSGTFIRFYFTATEEVLQGLTVTIGGVEIAPTLYNASSNIYYVQVENLSALQLKTMYEMTITDGESEYTVSYGVFSYMYGVLNNPQASEKLVNVAKATWLYADEAEKAVQILSGLGSSDDGEVEGDGEA